MAQPTQATNLFFLFLSLLAFASIFSINNAIIGVDAQLISCPKCIHFWNNFRQDAGCNGNSTICKYLPFVNTTQCQDMITAVCAEGIYLLNILITRILIFN
jgi:hypothetical protein